MSLADRDLVVVSPLPPRRSGIAAYTAELLEGLARHSRPVVVAEDPRAAEAPPGVPVISQGAWAAAGWLRRLPHLYQLGNNPDHAQALRMAMQVPGVAMLHDPVLHHVLEEMAFAGADPGAYAALLQACHGAGGRALAGLRQAGLFADALRYRMPLHQALLARCRGVLVHSRFAAHRLRLPPGLPLRVVPHHLSPRVAGHDGLSRAAARAALGLPGEVPVLVSLGHASRPKRIDLVLRALATLRDQGLSFRYLIAGEAEEHLELPQLAESLGLAAWVRITGWLGEDAFFTHARAADLLVNLRLPQGGETSGVLTRALGMGLPALVTDDGPSGEWPDDVVWKLAPAGDPLPGLIALLGRLLADPAGLAAQGARARALVRREASLDASVATYLAALRDWAGFSGTP